MISFVLILLLVLVFEILPRVHRHMTEDDSQGRLLRERMAARGERKPSRETQIREVLKDHPKVLAEYEASKIRIEASKSRWL